MSVKDSRGRGGGSAARRDEVVDSSQRGHSEQKKECLGPACLAVHWMLLSSPVEL